MASLIESVRKLHGPTLVEHDNGYDVDVICPECTRLRTEALEQATSDGEDWSHSAGIAHVSYPCATRTVAGTTAVEGKDESARMRLEHLVVQREELEERMERLDAVIGLIRRDLGEATGNARVGDGAEGEMSGENSRASARSSQADAVAVNEPSDDGRSDASGSEAPHDYDLYEVMTLSTRSWTRVAGG